MKRTILIPVVLFLFAGSGFNCEPGKVNPDKLTGKLVVAGPCGQYVIQVLKGDLDSSRIQKMYLDSGFFGKGERYSNVFTVRNVCDFAGYHLSKNDIFTFVLKDTLPDQNCAVCLIYYPVPTITNTVQQVQVISGM